MVKISPTTNGSKRSSTGAETGRDEVKRGTRCVSGPRGGY